jgi:hypothetical protein
VIGVSVRQLEVHTDEPLLHGTVLFWFEIAVVKLKTYKSPDNDHIPVELIQAVGETLLSEIHKLVYFIWNEEELPDYWKGLVIVIIKESGELQT